MRTSKVGELDVGLSAVGIEFSIARVKVDGLRVEFDGQLEVVVNECFLGFLLQIGRHCWTRMSFHLQKTLERLQVEGGDRDRKCEAGSRGALTFKRP